MSDKTRLILIVLITPIVIIAVAILMYLDNPDEEEVFRREANQHFKDIFFEAKDFRRKNFQLDELDAESKKMIQKLNQFQWWFQDTYERIKENKQKQAE